MDSTTADKIDKLYKNYEILSEAKDKISEVSISQYFIHSLIQILNMHVYCQMRISLGVISCYSFRFFFLSSFFIIFWKYLA